MVFELLFFIQIFKYFIVNELLCLENFKLCHARFDATLLSAPRYKTGIEEIELKRDRDSEYSIRAKYK